MILKNKKDLKNIIKQEENLYFKTKLQKYLKLVKYHPDYFSWKYIKYMRLSSYYYEVRRKNIINSLMYIINVRKMNSLGRKIGTECGENVFDKGLKIFHTHGNVINGNARVGENCRLYGNNCIGNNGIERECPSIGNNVRLCVGAKVLGNVTLADNIIVAAGAIVLDSCLEERVLLAGVPAKVVARYNVMPNLLD
ncbi:MAG: poly-gamma-glutamate biosynthesis protein [Clostridia bacterium]